MRPRQVPLPLVLLLACALFAAPFVLATTYYVDDDCEEGIQIGTDPNDHPFCTIRGALNGRIPGDVVLVRPGYYPERIEVPAGVIVMGQCAPATPCDPNNVCARRRADFDPNSPSTIDALEGGPAVFIAAIQAITVLDGFKITGAGSSGGHGVVITGNPHVCNNTITDNRSNGSGGGITVAGNATIEDNYISGNTAISGQGGGIAVRGGAPIITRNYIKDNSALARSDGFYGYGGGIAVFQTTAQAIITSNVITGNRADQGGGGIDVYRSSPTIAGNTVEGNRAGLPGRQIGHGGGIVVTGQQKLSTSTAPIIMNNLILRNEAQVSGGGVDLLFARPFLLNNNLFGNTPVNVHGSLAPASTSGNVSIDPNLPPAPSMSGPGYPHVDAGHGELVELDGDLFASDPNDTVVGDRRVVRAGPIGTLDFFHRPRALDGDQDMRGAPDIGAAEFVPGDDPNEPGVDPNGAALDDLDGDGHLDADPNADNCPAIYNLAQVDTDSDVVGDVCDNCIDDYNPSQIDGDGDLVGDACDADVDNDGVLEDFNNDGTRDPHDACVGKQKVGCDDNCPDITNVTQLDRDHDGVGDNCDNCDFRRNGYCDQDPNGPYDSFCDINKNGILTVDERATGGQIDSDGDGIGDACDNCRYTPNGNCFSGTAACDIDGDGAISGIELARGGLADRDDDKVGDACEVDLDRDMIPCRLVPLTMDPNSTRQIVVCDKPWTGLFDPNNPTAFDDNCPTSRNATQVDTDSDGVGDTCDNCDAEPNGSCSEDPNGDPNGVNDFRCDIDPNDILTAEERAVGRQLNTDGDADGNACDTDDDGDGVPDDGDPSNPTPMPCTASPYDPNTLCDDNCPLASNYNQANADPNSDSLGDACDPDPDGDGIDTGIAGTRPPGPCLDAVCDPDPDVDGIPTDGDPNTPAPNPCPAGPYDPNMLCDDNCPTVYNLAQADADGDLIGDDCDNCAKAYNPGQADRDGDWAGDVCDDNCPTDANPPSDCDLDPNTPDQQCDDDLDTIGDACDNCPDDANIFQDNKDRVVDPNQPQDMLGDACDSDPDGDGDPNAPVIDNCTGIYNPAQTDTDGDTLGDDCDNCPDDYNPAQTDRNLDGVPDQIDTDGDGLGDACDRDDDGDSIRDTKDNCPLIGNPLQTDQDKDFIGDACDLDADGDGASNSIDTCPDFYNASQADTDGDGFGDACDLCPALYDPVNTDGDGDKCGDPCDPPVLKPPAISGPASVTFGDPNGIYDVTLGGTSPWNATVDYEVRLQDPTGAATIVADVSGATLPASGAIRLQLPFPSTGPSGVWMIIAQVGYTGPVKAAGCGSVKVLTGKKLVTAN